MADWKDFESAEGYHNFNKVARVVILMQKAPKYCYFVAFFCIGMALLFNR